MLIYHIRIVGFHENFSGYRYRVFRLNGLEKVKASLPWLIRKLRCYVNVFEYTKACWKEGTENTKLSFNEA